MEREGGREADAEGDPVVHWCERGADQVLEEEWQDSSFIKEFASFKNYCLSFSEKSQIERKVDKIEMPGWNMTEVIFS